MSTWRVVADSPLTSTWLGAKAATGKSLEESAAAEADQHLRFTGQGLGHGVGLCQWGAKGLAAQGASASDILRRYFPQSRVRVPEGPVR